MAGAVQVITLFLLLASASCESCTNNYDDNDCALASSYISFPPIGACYIYSDDCAYSCGCNWDPMPTRYAVGLDDAYYASDDFECVYNDTWYDNFKYNCTLYEGAGWCMVNDDGETVEGPGWCNWLGPESENCNIPKGSKWPRHEGYANTRGKNKGRWAKSCCCDTGLYDTYPYELDSPGYGGDCVDKIGESGHVWNDQNAYSCRSYHFGSFCNMDGTTGSGWKFGFGRIKKYNFDGFDATEACCACGGGDWVDAAQTQS